MHFLKEYKTLSNTRPPSGNSIRRPPLYWIAYGILLSEPMNDVFLPPKNTNPISIFGVMRDDWHI